MSLKEHQISIFEELLDKKIKTSTELQELPDILNSFFNKENQESSCKEIVNYDNIQELVDSVYENIPSITKKEEALNFYDDLLKGLDPDYYPTIDRSHLEKVLENDRQWLLTRGVVWHLEDEE